MQERQLEFAFAETPRGGKDRRASDESDAVRYLRRIANPNKSPTGIATAAETDRLLELVAAHANLARALLNVRRNKGAPGTDGKTVEEVVRASKRTLGVLGQSLLDGSYRPGDHLLRTLCG